jgi:hypothetical protein
MERACRTVVLGLPSQRLRKFVRKRGHTFSAVGDSRGPLELHHPECCAQIILRLGDLILGGAEDLERFQSPPRQSFGGLHTASHRQKEPRVGVASNATSPLQMSRVSFSTNSIESSFVGRLCLSDAGSATLLGCSQRTAHLPATHQEGGREAKRCDSCSRDGTNACQIHAPSMP